VGSGFQKSIVIGVSGGIGGALFGALSARGGETVGLARSADGLDLLDEASVAGAAAMHAAGADLVIVATGALEAAGCAPEKSFAELEPAALAAAFATNALGPALAYKHFAPLMPRSKRTVFAFLSARVGSIGDNRLGGWMSYRASKAALNQIVRCAAIEAARANPAAIVLALHPGTIETAMTRAYARGRYTASADACAAMLLGVIDAADASMSGGFIAYDGSRIEW